MDDLSHHLCEAANDGHPQVSDEYYPVDSASGRDLLVALPLELAAECFRLLDLRDSITVSHVSRTWRLAALGDRRLWNRYHISQNCRNIAAAVDTFSTLLARSHPVPFRFVCDLEYDIPPAINDLVLSSLDRMAELKLNDGPQVADLMRRDAPLLHHLTCLSRHFDPFVLPAEWWALNVPRLKSLELQGFSIPSDCQPIATLRAFSALLPLGGVLDIPLTHVFPNLTSLNLRRVTQHTLPMLSPLPRALETVHLRGAATRAIDYSHFFSSISVPCRIRDLRVHSSSRFLDALRLFVRSYDGQWKLEVEGHHVRFHGVGDDTVLWDIECYNDYKLLSREPDIVLHLGRLAEFELPLVSFVYFERIRLHAWNRELPFLRSLTLLVDVQTLLQSDSESQFFNPFSGRHAGIGIGMPALEVVEFHCDSDCSCADCHGGIDINYFGSWLAHAAPGLLAALLRGNGSPKTLARVVIRTNYSYQPLCRDVAPLLQHAERLLIGAMVEADDALLVFERSTDAESASNALES